MCKAKTYWSTTAARQAWGAGLAANFTVQAADSSFSRTPSTVGIIVVPTIGTANSTTKNDVLFVYSVVSSHDDVILSYDFVSMKIMVQ
jgi:hypothetical protein